MIIVPVKEGENIEKALKKFKRKFEKTGVVRELRARQQYDKPSVIKRLKMEHAIYVQKLRAAEDQAAPAGAGREPLRRVACGIGLCCCAGMCAGRKLA